MPVPRARWNAVIVRPMLGDWELPAIERVDLVESRRLARLSVPGLDGDLHQDLGSGGLTVAISGSVHTDERRSQVLTQIQEKYLAGEPLPFVADIVESSELEDVVIVGFGVSESADTPDVLRYRIVLRQYVEPPPPSDPMPELPDDMLDELGELADGLLDGLDLPSLLGDIPSLADPTAAIRPAMDGVRDAVGDVPGMLGGLRDALGIT